MEAGLTGVPLPESSLEPARGGSPTAAGSVCATIRAVIFDMDGVLTDSEPLINAAAIAMFKEKGLTVQPEDFLPFVGTGEDMYLGGVAKKYQFPLDLPAAKARVYELYLALVSTQLNCFPGARQLVERCRGSGLKVAVASSADRIKITANLDKLGLPLASWDAAVTGEEVKFKKPAPDIFLLAAQKLGCLPSECAVVEDAVNGVAAAKAAGMRCVAVAQSFPATALTAAELVRERIAKVELSDLVGVQQSAVEPNIAAAALPPPLPLTLPTRPWGFWATLGLGVAIGFGWILAQAVITAIMAFWLSFSHHGHPPPQWETSGQLIAVATCFSAPVAVGLACLFVNLRGANLFQYLGLKPISLKTTALWLLFFSGFLAISDGLTTVLDRPLVPEFMQQAYRTAGWLPLFWVALVVAAPIAEETIFRGFVFQGLLHSRVGAWGAIGLTALTWSAIHVQYDVYGIATIFVAGLWLGYVRWRTGSLVATILLHGFMNLVATAETAWFVR